MSFKSKVVPLAGQVSRFGIVGGAVTLLGILAYYILYEIYDLPLLPVYLGANIVAVLLTYLLNSRFTFGHPLSVSAAIKYFSSYTFSILVGMVLLALLDSVTNLENFNLILIVIPLRVLLSFVLVKLTVFKSA